MADQTRRSAGTVYLPTRPLRSAWAFLLVLLVGWAARAEAQERAGGTIGVCASGLWVIQPGAPGNDFGAGAELGFFADWRFDPNVPLSVRLELAFGAESDSGAGTLALQPRVLLGVHLADAAVLHVGGFLGLAFFAGGYSRPCAPCSGEDAATVAYGAYTDLMISLRIDPSSSFTGRVEIGPSAVFEGVELRGTVLAGRVGVRAAVTLW